jgi:hypothetical protein
MRCLSTAVLELLVGPEIYLKLDESEIAGVCLCRPDCQPDQQVPATDAHSDAGDPDAEERWHEVDAGGARRRAPVPDTARPVACSGSALPLR